MQEKTAQEKIIHYLRVKPSNHGEVERVLLAIPNKEKVKSEISQQERELIEETFKEQGTNLIPIIVRRIEPDEEEHEYEVVYGQKWCIIAEELEIDRLWTWVFDLKDDQVPLIQEKMADLAGNPQVPKKTSDGLVKAIEINLEQGLVTELKAGTIQVNFEIKPTADTSGEDELKKVYEEVSVNNLKKLAKERNLTKYSGLSKAQLIQLHLDWHKNQTN